MTALSALLAAPACEGAVLFGQVNDFEDGLTAGWQKGSTLAAAHPPTVVASDGPGGAGDAYLENVSTGTGTMGGKMVQFNQSTWSGNYAAAGVTRIACDLANFGEDALSMRIALQGRTTGTWYGSNTAFPLPADGVWRHVTFELTPGAMGSIAGPDTLSGVLTDVGELRLLSAPGALPNFQGQFVAATLGVDNIRAQRLQGDADFDGIVGPGDFNLLATNFGKNTGATWSQGDFNFDGRVGPEDFNLLATNFGRADGGVTSQGQLASAVSAVPEPGVMSLAIIGAAATMLRRRRRSNWA